MIEKHYGRFMTENEDAQLALLNATVGPAEQPESRVKPRPPRGHVEVSARNAS